MAPMKNVALVAALGLSAIATLSKADESSARQPKAVEVSLHAEWADTNLLSEMAEAVAGFSESAFWTFIRSASRSESATQESRYATGLSVLPVAIQGEGASQLIRAETAARVFSPAVQHDHVQGAALAAEHAPRECRTDSFIVVESGAEKSYICDVDKLNAALETMVDCDVSVSCEGAGRVLPRANLKNRKSGEAFDPRFEMPPRKDCVCATLFANPGTSRTRKLLAALEAAEYVNLRVRHFGGVPNAGKEQTGRVGLMGFGVTADIKNMEYKALNDEEKKEEDTASNAKQTVEATPGEPKPVAGIDFKRLHKRYPTLKEPLAAAQTALSEAPAVGVAVPDSLDMKVWELQDLGFQAAVHVLNSSSPIDKLVDTLHNFPARAGQISRLPKTADFTAMRRDFEALHHVMQGGTDALWLNGRSIDPTSLDLFALLERVRADEKLIGALETAIVSTPRAQTDSSPGSQQVARSQAAQAALQCVDRFQPDSAPRVRLPSGLVTWFNNIEKDAAYKSMRRPLKEILKPGYYGRPQLPRRNVLNAVFVVDAGTVEGLAVISTAFRALQQGVPVRLGVMFAPTESEVSHLVATVVRRLAENQDALMGFLSQVMQAMPTAGLLELDHVAAAAREMGDDATIDTSAVDYIRERLQRTGIRTLPFMSLNGRIFTEDIDNAVFQHFYTELGVLKQLVAAGQLKDADDDMFAAVHDALDAVTRYQAAIFDRVQFAPLDVEAEARLMRGSQKAHWFRTPAADAETQMDRQKLGTIDASVVLFLDGRAGAKALGDAVAHVSGCSGEDSKTAQACAHQRFAFVVCGDGDDAAAMRSVVTRATLKQLGTFAKELQSTPAMPVYEVGQRLGTEFHVDFSAFRQDACGAELAQAAVSAGKAVPAAAVTNGRVTPVDDSFAVEDFATMVTVERQARAVPVVNCLQGLDFEAAGAGRGSKAMDQERFAAVVAAVSSLLANDTAVRGARQVPPISQAPAAVRIPLSGVMSVAGSAKPRHTVLASINPVSRVGQRLVSLVLALRDSLDMSADVIVNPPQNLESIPLKNFYRYSFASELRFDHATGAVAAPRVLMKGLPQSPVLTLGVDEPESWLVFADRAEHDLDNLRLETASGDVTVGYGLKALVVTGSCYERHTFTPPRGLQLVLHSSAADGGAAAVRDTLVMSNLGYFQLQASPGEWRLSIRRGRGSKIFQLVTEAGEPAPTGQFTVHVRSFLGAHLTAEVQRREGMAKAELLLVDGKESGSSDGAGAVNGGLLSKLGSFISGTRDQDDDDAPEDDGVKYAGGAGAVVPSATAQPTLNIFSLASGHLYERFLRLMMFTVMKNVADPTASRVKFWLIENPLSPQFKKLLPHLARKYGFDYELVRYKWPSWLRKQTEKQRFIWAYKVLFLDVLFPLDVKRVIFVDADQIVQADLHELYNLDLEGRPVAYTPFCQVARREETKGFRFWDSGFWKDHLQGRPYHISAIYVVDLERLRLMGAGDTYRITYQRLSADPNSLANLDQDLPNFAQHQVPIFSLPEEWLWCETWCNDASKTNAKTIDLCNNPQTKTPKLVNAKRIVPEWEAMDAEVAAFADAVEL